MVSILNFTQFSSGLACEFMVELNGWPYTRGSLTAYTDNRLRKIVDTVHAVDVT